VPRSKTVVQQQLFEKINAISFMISSNWGKKRTKTIFNIISILYALCMIQINKRIKSNVGAAKSFMTEGNRISFRETIIRVFVNGSKI
jgi:hypothetical protein